MNWIEMPRIFPEIRSWGTSCGNWQYVLSYNYETEQWGASAKLYPDMGDRIDLGFHHATRAEAEAACQWHCRRMMQ
jgi:hypothetical protein